MGILAVSVKHRLVFLQKITTRVQIMYIISVTIECNKYVSSKCLYKKL